MTEPFGYIEGQKTGDLPFYGNPQWKRLAIGTASQFLKVVSGLPSWATLFSEAITGWAGTGDLADVAAAEATGSALTAPRGDHVHAHGSGYLPDAHHNQAHSASDHSDMIAWAAYTPTITASVGTFTTVAGAGRWLQLGKTLFLSVTITITTNGTASGSITIPLPNSLTAKGRTVLPGREDSATGDMLQAYSVDSSGDLVMFNYTNNFPGGDGRTLFVGGVLEVN